MQTANLATVLRIRSQRQIDFDEPIGQSRKPKIGLATNAGFVDFGASDRFQSRQAPTLEIV
jgi:hypothetical protein